MALLDRIRDVQRTRRLSRELAGIHTQLKRIADALDRAVPITTAPAPNSVEVQDPDLDFAAKMEVVEADFFRTRHRYPDADEAAAHYEEVKHLL